MTRAMERRGEGRSGTKSRVRFLIGALLTLAAEAYLFLQFQPHDLRSGALTHLFIGASVALVGMTVWLVEEQRPVPLPGAWLVTGHLLAVLPDVLFAAGIAHRHWMDAFLGHLISHRVSGGNLLWYAVFLVALAVYLALDVRVRSRRSTGGRRRRRA